MFLLFARSWLIVLNTCCVLVYRHCLYLLLIFTHPLLASFFVHRANRPQPAPLPGGMGKKYIRKIVQFRALLCSFDLAIFCGRWWWYSSVWVSGRLPGENCEKLLISLFNFCHAFCFGGDFSFYLVAKRCLQNYLPLFVHDKLPCFSVCGAFGFCLTVPVEKEPGWSV